MRTILAAGLVAFSCDAFALDAAMKPSQYIHESWDMRDGLPMNSVVAVESDADGFLWFGTEEGSGWFDGERFVFRDRHTTPELAPHMLDVVPLGGGSVCFALLGTRIVCLMPDGRSTLASAEGAALTTGETSPRNPHATRDSEGRVWLADKVAGLFRMEDTVLRKIVARPASSIEAARDGGLWVGSAGAVLRIRGDEVAEEFALPKGAGLVTSLAVGDDAVWLIGGARVYVLREGAVTDVALPASAGAPSAIFEDRDRNVWVGTTAGLVRLRGGVLSRFPANHPLASANVFDLTEDRDGSLWIAASPTGLHRLRSGSFTTVGVDEGLRQATVWAVGEEQDGTILIGGEGGLHRYRDGAVREIFGRAEGLPADVVRDLAVGADGSIWVASLQRAALGRVRGNRAETVDLSGVLSSEDVRNEIVKVAVDGAGDLWAGALGSRLVQMRDGKPLRVWNEDDGLVPRSFAIGTAPDGTTWVGGEFGISFMEKDRVRTVAPKIVPDAGIDNVLGDGTRLWVSASNGVYLVEGGEWFALSTLPEMKVQSLLDDGLGYLWASGNLGIYRFSRDEAVASRASGKPVTVEWFGVEDGMRTAECDGPRHSSLKARDGRLWFATANGAVWIDPTRVDERSAPVAVRIVEMRIDRQRVDPASLPAGTRRFEIDYTASVLRAPKRAHFRYRLEGVDPDWIDAGNRRTAYYTNVSPGTYRFRVIAADDNGIWNETGASMAVSIAPYLHQTRWFALACLAGLGGIVAGGFRLRSRQLVARAKDLERQVDEATGLLAARMDEKLARTGQVARFGEFAASVAHNLKTPLTFLRGEIELLDEKRRSGNVAAAELESALRALLEQVRRMNAEIDTGMSFVRPGAAPIVDVDLAALAREIALLLRSRATASNVKIDIAIDGELRVRGNLDNLRHAIANLVSNAIDAMPGGGTVTISGRRSEGFVELRVADTGPGIPESVRAKLFRPFVSTKGEQGTGLGLASCRRIVEEEHGGKIRLKPSSAGATFVLELPS